MHKKKIVIWGTAKRAAMYSEWLMDIFEVVAYVSTNSISGDIHGIPVLTSEEMVKVEFDLIILCVEQWDLDMTKDKIAQIDAAVLQKAKSIDDIVESNTEKSYLSFTNNRQIEIIKELLAASDEEALNYDWMLKRVLSFGLFCFYDEIWPSVQAHWTVYGLQQIPEEFAAFCNQVAKQCVQSAAEIGVYRGRSAYFLCAILARHSSKMRYKMIDIVDRLDDFALFQEVLPQLEKCIPKTSANYKEYSFDFVFIDADHSYDASIADYENVGRNAEKMVAMHDIYAHEYDNENGGIVRTWEEVLEKTSDKVHHIFSIYPNKWMGIGCVEMS